MMLVVDLGLQVLDLGTCRSVFVVVGVGPESNTGAFCRNRKN